MYLRLCTVDFVEGHQVHNISRCPLFIYPCVVKITDKKIKLNSKDFAFTFFNANYVKQNIITTHISSEVQITQYFHNIM